MSRKKRSRKRPGHYCWACDQRRPNEKFSGAGHAKHVCRDCSKLGARELTYLQDLRNLERCMNWDGIIPRKRRKTFEQFLSHDDPRIREMAEVMRNDDIIERAMLRGDCELVESMLDSGVPTSMFDTQMDDLKYESESTDDPDWDSELPF